MGSWGAARGQKKSFNGRQPSMEDDFWWKIPFRGRRPAVEDDLQWILACRLLCFAAFLKEELAINLLAQQENFSHKENSYVTK